MKRRSPRFPFLFALPLCSFLLPVAFPAVAGPRYQTYFGDLHTHTAYTDGTGTPWDAYAMARDAGADFLAVTDHDSYGFYLTPEKWQDTLLAANSFTTRSFVAMAAYEFWLAGSGEILECDGQRIE